MSDSPELRDSDQEGPNPGTSQSAGTSGLSMTGNHVTLSLEQLKLLLSSDNTPKQAEPEVSNNKGKSEKIGADYSDEEEPLSSDDESDNVAEPVESKLAAYIDDRLTVEQPKEKLKLKFDKASRPTNIEHAKEVKVDRELFNNLSNTAKKRDASLRKIQNITVKAVNNMAKVADFLVKKGKVKGDIVLSEADCRNLHSLTINGLGLACQASQKINANRVSNKL